MEVGVHAYFFDDKLVAFSFQAEGTEEMSNAEIQWVWESKEAAARVRDFLREINGANKLGVSVYDANTGTIHASWLNHNPDRDNLRPAEK